MTTTLIFREAKIDDLPSVVNLLHDDSLGKTREQVADFSVYEKAMGEILLEPNNKILVAIVEKEIVATLQLTFIRNLTFQGGLRAQIEGVRTHSRYRGQGIGKDLVLHAIDLAQKRSCHLVQLTTNKSRPDAIRFYQSIGFQPSHIGFKLSLDEELKG